MNAASMRPAAIGMIQPAWLVPMRPTRRASMSDARAQEAHAGLHVAGEQREPLFAAGDADVDVGAGGPPTPRLS